MPRAATIRLSAACVLLVQGCAAAKREIPEGYPLASGVLSALEGHRPFALRWTATQRHQRCEPLGAAPAGTEILCRGAPSTEAAARLLEQAVAVGEALRLAASTDALWASALLDVAYGRDDARRLDRAIPRLREVLARTDSLPLAASHLVIALAARAAVRDDARDLWSALDLSARLRARSGGVDEQAFNHAVLLSRVGTVRQAHDAWQEQLGKGEGPWHEEAGERDGALPRSLPRFVLADTTADAVRRDPQGAREAVLDTLLVMWGDAVLAGDTQITDSASRRMAAIGRTLVALSGDSSVLHIAHAVASARASSDVARAILALREGTSAYRLTQYSSARGHLRSASVDFRRAGATILADWSDLLLGAVMMAMGDYPAATSMLGAVGSRAANRHDLALEGRARWAMAIAIGRSGAMIESRRAFSMARGRFAQAGEGRNAAILLTALGEVEGFLGRSLESANLMLQGFVASVAATGEVRYEDLLVAGQHLVDRGEAHAASVLLREAVLGASKSARAKDLPEALGRLALVESAIGAADSAAAHIARARRHAPLVKDSVMRARLEAELDRAELKVLAARDPRGALALADRSLAYFERIPIDGAALLVTRSRLALAVGDVAQGARDLERATEMIRSLAPSATGEAARQLQATMRDARRTLVALNLARGDSAAAYAETVALSGDTGPGPLRRGALPALPPGRGELRAVVLPKRLLTWLRVGGEAELREVAAGDEEIAPRVMRFVDLLRSGDDSAAARDVGQQLYALLLRPHAARLSQVTALDVGLDGVLAELPVAMLVDEASRLVIERRSVRYLAASASSAGASVRETSPPSVPLLVGSPAWNEADFPGLEALRWSDEEIRRLGEMYPMAAVLTGRAATKDALVRAVARHDVLHFAGHARVVAERPSASHLVLASGSGGFDAGVLYAHEIAALPLRRLQLAVLSACGRASGGPGNAGDANGLALAFLDAGAHGVVSGLWEVDDASTAQLMTRLHAELAQGVVPEEALRRAQLSVIAGGDRDRRARAVAAAFTVHVRDLPWGR